jgi:anti-anti-sigma factor
MATGVQAQQDGDRLTIRIHGHFGYQVYREFRDAYQHQAPGMRYVIDLQHTDYMDSSALGMLLVLREHAGSGSASVAITRCKPEVRKILQIANFERLFDIS